MDAVFTLYPGSSKISSALCTGARRQGGAKQHTRLGPSCKKWSPGAGVPRTKFQIKQTEQSAQEICV